MILPKACKNCPHYGHICPETCETYQDIKTDYEYNEWKDSPESDEYFKQLDTEA